MYEDLAKKRWRTESGRVGDAFNINTRSGQNRGYQWLAASRWIEKAQAWAIGNRRAIGTLLGTIDTFGKMGRNGYGQIKEIKIEAPGTGEEEFWRLRALPESVPGLSGVAYAPMLVTIRPPYWKKTARQVAMVPVI